MESVPGKVFDSGAHRTRVVTLGRGGASAQRCSDGDDGLRRSSAAWRGSYSSGKGKKVRRSPREEEKVSREYLTEEGRLVVVLCAIPALWQLSGDQA
jgi:hypothetical protein